MELQMEVLRFVYSLPVAFLRASAKPSNFALAVNSMGGRVLFAWHICVNNSNTFSPPVFIRLSFIFHI